jgi:hypothetical protein
MGRYAASADLGSTAINADRRHREAAEHADPGLDSDCCVLIAAPALPCGWAVFRGEASRSGLSVSLQQPSGGCRRSAAAHPPSRHAGADSRRHGDLAGRSAERHGGGHRGGGGGGARRTGTLSAVHERSSRCHRRGGAVDIRLPVKRGARRPQLRADRTVAGASLAVGAAEHPSVLCRRHADCHLLAARRCADPEAGVWCHGDGARCGLRLRRRRPARRTAGARHRHQDHDDPVRSAFVCPAAPRPQDRRDRSRCVRPAACHGPHLVPLRRDHFLDHQPHRPFRTLWNRTQKACRRSPKW